MPKRFIKRLLPHHSEVKEHKFLKHLGTLLHDPNLWHLNRHSVSKAVALGLFIAYVPLPFQMVLAAILAIWLRVNLPISVALIWISNPITIPPMFYGAYKFGSWLLNQPPQQLEFELSIDWLTNSVGGIWEPLLLGSLVLGSALALAGYLTTRLIWRLWVINHWKRRCKAHRHDQSND